MFLSCSSPLPLPSQNGGSEPSPVMFSSMPTNPRDWITVDALPSQLSQWQASALYIIGDKPVLREVPEDLYPNCTFVPVEVSSLPAWEGEWV